MCEEKSFNLKNPSPGATAPHVAPPKYGLGLWCIYYVMTAVELKKKKNVGIAFV